MLIPCPGMSTQESRGMLTTVTRLRSADTCMSISVSEFVLTSSPTCSTTSWWWVSPVRWSTPATRMFSGPVVPESDVPASTRLMVSLMYPVSPQAPPATISTTADSAPQIISPSRRRRASRLVATRAASRPCGSECRYCRGGRCRRVPPRPSSRPSLMPLPRTGTGSRVPAPGQGTQAAGRSPVAAPAARPAVSPAGQVFHRCWRVSPRLGGPDWRLGRPGIRAAPGWPLPLASAIVTSE